MTSGRGWFDTPEGIGTGGHVDADSPLTIGQYRIQGQLGRGGMGVVYLAEDSESGRLCALKTVKLPQIGLLQSIRREIHTLSRLNHRGIVRILDEGVHEGLPWYAMELLEGPTLRHFSRIMSSTDSVPPTRAVEDTPASSLPAVNETESIQGPIGHESNRTDTYSRLPVSGFELPSPHVSIEPAVGAGRENGLQSRLSAEHLATVLTLMRRLCVPLAYLHGEGIIHRDLKPDNVVILDECLPVIVDFGLNSRYGSDVSREVLQVDGLSAGTLSYMSPEQIHGAFVDARSDLYSLGCIMFEMLTGFPPFSSLRHSAGETIRGHLFEIPPLLSDFLLNVPQDLDVLVRRLLEKNPRDRIGYAQDVERTLAELGGRNGCFSGAPPARPHIYRSGFIGREASQSRLNDRIDELVEGRGGIAMVLGESGVGKTRLLLEIGRYALSASCIVLTGECQEQSEHALEGMRGPLQAIADLCSEEGHVETDRIFGIRGKVLAQYDAALKTLPGQDSYAEPSELPAQAARLRFFVSLKETFSALSKRHPVLVLIDDFQWAGDLTAGYVDFLVQGHHPELSNVLFLLSSRSEEANEMTQGILNALAEESITLKRLDEISVGAIIQDMLAIGTNPLNFSRFVAENAEGNPFFIAEYLRTAVESGVITRDIDGRWLIPEEVFSGNETSRGMLLPRSVKELLVHRLEGFSTGARALIDAAAILGRTVPLDLVKTMTTGDDESFLEAIAELLLRHIIEDTGMGTIRFTHDKIRAFAENMLDVQQRILLHREAASAIERLYAGQPDEHLATLGRHLEEAGDIPRARDCYGRAASIECAHFIWQDACTHYQAYFRLLDQTTEHSIEERLVYGNEALRHAGRMTEAIQEVTRALEETRLLANKALEGRCLLYLGSLYKIEGQLETGHGFLLEALTLLREAGDRKYEAHAMNHLSICLSSLGEFHAASLEINKSLAIFKELGEQRLEGEALSNAGMIAFNQGKFDEAADFYSRALEIHRQTGGRQSEAITLANLAIIMESQDAQHARDMYQQAIDIHREVGDRAMEGLTMANLAELLKELGDIEQALIMFERALAIVREIGHQTNEVFILLQLSTIKRICFGETAMSQELTVQAGRILEKKGEMTFTAVYLAECAKIAIVQGRDPAPHVDKLRIMCEKAAVEPTASCSQYLRSLIALRRAFLASEHDRIFRGELIGEISPGLRQWLNRRGDLSLSSQSD